MSKLPVYRSIIAPLILFLGSCATVVTPSMGPFYGPGDCVISQVHDLKMKFLIMDVTETGYFMIDQQGNFYKTTIGFDAYEAQVTECFDF